MWDLAKIGLARPVLLTSRCTPQSDQILVGGYISGKQKESRQKRELNKDLIKPSLAFGSEAATLLNSFVGGLAAVAGH